jgi:hypothetical protein
VANNLGTPTIHETVAYTLRSYTAGLSVAFSSRLTNESRFNYTSNEVTDNTVVDAFGGSTPVNLAQVAGLAARSDPDVSLFFAGNNNVELSQALQPGSQRQWNLLDTVSVSLGRHQFKFGVDYRRLTPVAANATPQVGYDYYNASEVIANTPGFTYVDPWAPGHPLYLNFSAFAQDQWRVSERLSLALGLRWEVNPAPGVTQGSKPYTLQGTGPDNWILAPQGTQLWRTTWYNFAPRLGAAYILHDAPGRETVLRAGGGVFFDTGQQGGSTGFQGPGFTLFVTPGPASFGGSVAVPPIVNPPVSSTGGTGFAAHLQLPYTLQWNASIEQGLSKSQAVTVSYVGSHASRLLRSQFFFPSNNPNGTYFQFFTNGLSSDYDSLQIQFRRRLSRGLTALASYTWSHCLDYGSENLSIGYQRGNCDFDVRHNLSTALSYDLPNPSQKEFARALLSHWGVDNRFTVRTAFPVTLQGNYLLLANGQEYNQGLNFVPGQPVYIYGSQCAAVYAADFGATLPCPEGRAINPNAFVNASSGLGDAPRNFARGFGAWEMDLAVRREFPVFERLKLQFRAEAFNLFNHPNFGSVNSYFGQATFGQATGTLASSLGILSPLYQMGGPRSMQFALKLIF